MGFLDTLRCPDCHEALVYTQHPAQDAPGEYGVLTCSCYAYPVIDSVPIVNKAPVGVLEHATSKVDFVGADPQGLTALIRAGHGGEALVQCIAFPAIPPRLYQLMVRHKGWPFRRLRGVTTAIAEGITALPLYQRVASMLRRRTLRRGLHDRFTSFNTEDWFDLFYRRSAITGDFYPYYLFRQSQPRFLVAISLLDVLPEFDRPILDVACGFGHLTRHLTECCKPAHRGVGLDRLFFQAWVAKHWLATGAEFIVADADCDLPFADGTFSAMLCSDAFSYLHGKDKALLEIERVAPGGPLVFTRTGNGLVEPNEAQELGPAGYCELFGERSHWISSESDLLAGYLARRAPNLAADTDPAAQNDEKWLSMVVSDDPRIRRDHGRFERWPHAVGRLAVNPVYRATRGADGSLRLEFHFPSDWYAFQQSAMPEFHADSITLPAAVCEQLERGERPDGADALIDQFVLVGVPERYTNGESGSRHRHEPTGPVLKNRFV